MKYSSYNVIIPRQATNGFLLANTFSGSVFKINPEEKGMIENNCIAGLNKDTMESYKQCGVIIEDNFDEKKMLVYLNNRDKFKSTVLSLTILLTNACNFACSYCYEGSHENAKSLTPEIKKRIYHFIETMLKQNDHYNSVNIVLFGGEPLLVLDESMDWLMHIKKSCEDQNKNFTTGIVTNGSLLTPDTLCQLKSINCKFIQFTLDGNEIKHNLKRYYKSGKGSFDGVLSAIETTCNAGFIAPTIRINIDKANIDSIENLMKILVQKGYNKNCHVYFGILRTNSDLDFKEDELGDTLEPLWRLLKKHHFNFNVRPFRRSMYCGLYKDTSFTIDPEGHVFKCWEFVGDKEFEIGKIDKRGDLQIEPPFFNWMTHDFRAIRECEECAYLPLCGGGCASVRKNNHGNVNSPGCLETRGIFKNQILFYYDE